MDFKAQGLGKVYENPRYLNVERTSRKISGRALKIGSVYQVQSCKGGSQP